MTRRTIDQLYALTIPEIQEVFLQVMQDVVDEAILSEMITAIEAGNAEALFKATGFTPAALAPILDRIEQVYKDSGELTVGGWPTRIRTPTGLTTFRFDMRNPQAEDYLKTSSSGFIARITNDVRENVRGILEKGMVEGQNPRRTALNIVGVVDPVTKKRTGGVIGLTPNQEGWVNNTRKRLERLDKGYFNLKLRDKRFDATVRKAIENKTPLPKNTIDKLMISYRNKVLLYRGSSIARTETIASINTGEFDAYRQAVEDGTIQQKALMKEWDDAGDGRVRTTHNLLGKKYSKGKGINLEEPFVSPSGARLMHPGDSSLGAPASEVMVCRCKSRYRVDWSENAK